MQKINVLVFPAGEINSVELHDALCGCVNINVFGASSVDRHGSYIFENYTADLPMITAPDFLERFNLFLDKNKIDVVFPTHDSVAMVLAENSKKIHAKLACSCQKTAVICRDKEKTYKALSGADFLPKIYSKITEYPVFIKPKEGQGGVGARLVNSPKDIPNVNLNAYVICEYLPGKEYTVDCLTDKDGQLRWVSPRSRQRVMAGVSVAGQIEKLTPEIQKIAQFLNQKLSFLGLWWFQIKQDKNEHWKLMEVSVRCAGTMALTRACGVNLPLLTVYTVMGYDITVEPNSYYVKMDSSLIRRYKIDYDYDTVYFDFDDTLIVRDKVNLKAVWFLYQCQNNNKKVILLTKHEKEIFDSMEYYHIHKNIFDDIIHIKPNDNKADYISPKKAVFIDNSYHERHAVYIKHHIPVFDVDGLDVLMNWKS